MKLQGLAAFIVPYADAFQSRNRTSDGGDRLAWLTDFRGSAGTALITADKAAVFVDSRYALSARTQIDAGLYEIVDETVKPEAWLPSGAILGYDPFLHTKSEVDAWVRAGLAIKACAQNPVDAAWGEKGFPVRRAITHEIKYAGRSVGDKLDAIAASVRDSGAEAIAITRPDSISWLLNLRVPDIDVTPVVHGYVLLDAIDAHAWLYTDVDCSAAGIAAAFGNRVSVRPLRDIDGGVREMAAKRNHWQVDDYNSPLWFRGQLEGFGAQVTHAVDPVTWPKACKNDVEQAGIRASHVRDGVSLVKILYAVDTNKTLTERDIEALVLNVRAEEPSCFTHSFSPIVGFNENGAFIHGQIPDDRIKTVTGDGLLLIDSGGQYLDGTTDVTRTLAIGVPTPEMKRAFTTILRGHIALARAVFPEGTSGGQLDALARAPLWEAGYDYGHGTGHGVGYCLNVHEGPCNFSPKVARAAEPLKVGILMSVEPGVYLEGKFGIRLENLYLVVPHRPRYLRLDAVTLAPFDTRAIDLGLMRDDEKEWLNAYHARVLDTLSPHLPPPVVRWLTARCAAV